MAPPANSNHGADNKVPNYSLNINNNNRKEVPARARRPSNEQKLQRAASDGAVIVKGKVGDDEEEQITRCECCGLSEECTAAYVRKVREVFCGRWICGLCSEAVQEERNRMGPHTPIAEALQAHISLCLNFNSFTRTNPAVHVAHAMRQLLKKKTTPTPNPTPNTPRLPRTTSCIPSLK